MHYYYIYIIGNDVFYELSVETYSVVGLTMLQEKLERL